MPAATPKAEVASRKRLKSLKTIEAVPGSLPLLNERHEAFCQMLATGIKATPAYISAGYAKGGAAQSAHILLSKTEIVSRIEYFKTQGAICKVSKVLFDRDRVINRLDELSRAAQADGNHSAAVRCEELIGKQLGMFVERHDHNLTWDGNMASLSAAQLTVMLVTLPQTAFADDPEGLEAWQRDTAGLLDAPAGVVIEATAETVAPAKAEEERK